MTTSLLTPEIVDNLRTFFPDRREPNYSLGNIYSTYMLTPRLYSFIPGNNDVQGDGNVLYDVIQNNPFLNVSAVFGIQTILGYNVFDGVDDQIHALDTNIIDANMTVFGWFRFDAGSLGSSKGLMTKWTTAGNLRCYALYKNASNNIVFEITELGTAATLKTVTSTQVVTSGQWYFLAGSCEVSTAITVWSSDPTIRNLNSVQNVTAIPAARFDSTTPQFRVGSRDTGEFLDGDGTLYGRSAMALPGAVLRNLYQTALPILG